MRVERLMSTNVHYCTLQQTAADAVQAMREHDVGCIPIVNEARMPIGMVTDRDVCLATHSLDLPPSKIAMRDVMSQGIFSCQASESLESAERVMRDWRVRRLPVVDEAGTLVGVLSLNDLIMASQHSSLARAKERIVGDLQATLVAICHPPRPRAHDAMTE